MLRINYQLITLLAACAVAALAGETKDPAVTPGAGKASAAAPAVSASSRGNAVVVPSLKGILFLSKAEDLQASGADTPGVITKAVPMLDNAAFRSVISAQLGHPLTWNGLDKITHDVVQYYRSHNHPVVDAVVPAQNIESGVIQVVVTEFRVGAVRAEGNRWFSSRIVTSPLSLKHGDVIDSTQLISQMDAANTNPFRRVNLVYQPSAQAGYTDLVLKTEDRLPVRAFTGFDNSGTPITGRNRWEAGITWGNALWHDQQLSYQFSSSTNFFTGRSAAAGQPAGASFVGHTLSWSMPVRGRDSISVFGGYQRSIPNLGQDFGLVGRSGEAGIHYNLALHRTAALVQTLQVGYDFKVTNNNLAFGGAQIMRNNAQIDQFPVTYAANLTDRLGSTAITTSIVFSPGGLGDDNSDEAFQPAVGQSGRLMAQARYVYWRADLNRLTRLPANFTWSSRAVGQLSSANLLYTEQLAAGGPELLRGYDPNSILGDRGIVLSNELRTPSFHKAGEFRFGQLQFLGFWDFAHLNSVHNVEDAINHVNASSIGSGLRYNLRSNMTAKFDYGWQLQHLPGSNDRDHLLNFGLLFAY